MSPRLHWPSFGVEILALVGPLAYGSSYGTQHSTKLRVSHFVNLLRETGCASSFEEISAVLRAVAWDFAKGSATHGPILDVGASIGAFSSYILDLFGQEQSHHAYMSNGFNSYLALHAWEPSARAGVALSRRAREDHWGRTPRVRWFLWRRALGDVAVANVTLFGCVQTFPSEGAPWDNFGFVQNNCALSPGASGVKEYRGPNAVPEEQSVSVSRLDDFLPRLRSTCDGTKEIFLVKIDAEGHDHAVLRGMRRALTRHHVRFLLFEYGPRWAHDGRPNATLRRTILDLHAAAYACFLLMETALVPLLLQGPWNRFLHIIDGRREGNVFCARMVESELGVLQRIVLSYSSSPFADNFAWAVGAGQGMSGML